MKRKTILKLRELLHPPRTAFLFGVTILTPALLLAFAAIPPALQEYRLLSAEGVRTTARVVRVTDNITQTARGAYEFSDSSGRTHVLPPRGRGISSASTVPIVFARSDPSVFHVGDAPLVLKLASIGVISVTLLFIGGGICVFAAIKALRE
jgi:hypothetical protein